MGNDLKYGLVLGLVILLIFIGWVAIKRPASEPPDVSGELASEEVTEDVGFWEPPQLDVTTPPRPPQTAEFEIGPADDVESGAPLMPGARDLVDTVRFPEETYGTDEQDFAADTEGAATERTYVIAKGDDLGKISTKLYGTSRHWKLIAKANNNVIPNPDVLTVGTTIVIPALDDTPVRAADSEPPVETDSQTSSSRTHTVAKGDNLYKIAVEYYGDGGEFKKIYEANKDKLSSPDAVLKIGMKLTIP